MAEEKKQSVTVYSYRKVWFVEKKIYASLGSDLDALRDKAKRIAEKVEVF